MIVFTAPPDPFGNGDEGDGDYRRAAQAVRFRRAAEHRARELCAESPGEGLTPRQHLDWCADRALEMWDLERGPEAVALFVLLASRRDETRAFVATLLAADLLLHGARGGRDSFERAMRGFRV